MECNFPLIKQQFLFLKIPKSALYGINCMDIKFVYTVIRLEFGCIKAFIHFLNQYVMYMTR